MQLKKKKHCQGFFYVFFLIASPCPVLDHGPGPRPDFGPSPGPNLVLVLGTGTGAGLDPGPVKFLVPALVRVPVKKNWSCHAVPGVVAGTGAGAGARSRSKEQEQETEARNRSKEQEHRAGIPGVGGEAGARATISYDIISESSLPQS